MPSQFTPLVPAVQRGLADSTRAMPITQPKTGSSKPAPVPQPAPNLTSTIGADTLWGGSGADTYSAGAGDDLLLATSGNDTISGGSGYDVLDYSKVNADLSLTRGGVLAKSGGAWNRHHLGF